MHLYDSLFQLCDVWTAGVTADEYVAFLRIVFQAVASGEPPTLKPLKAIGWVDAEAEAAAMADAMAPASAEAAAREAAAAAEVAAAEAELAAAEAAAAEAEAIAKVCSIPPPYSRTRTSYLHAYI